MGRPIAVTVQYPGFEHEERLHDLGAGSEFEFVPLLKKPFPRCTDAVSYAAELVAGLGPDSPPVGAVVAWCTSSAIGVEVARLLQERFGTAPLFVALDGVPCTAAHIAEAYQLSVDRYARGRVGELRFTTDELRARPDEVLAAMRAELTRCATDALLTGIGQAEVVAPIVDEVVSVSMGWMYLLVSAHNSAHEPWDGDAIVVTSSETQFPGAWPGVERLRTVPVDCAAANLLRADGLAPLITDHLAACSANPA